MQTDKFQFATSQHNYIAWIISLANKIAQPSKNMGIFEIFIISFAHFAMHVSGCYFGFELFGNQTKCRTFVSKMNML